MKLIFERLRDLAEVRSSWFFILIGLCENVLHEKLSKNPSFFSQVKYGMYDVHICCLCRVAYPSIRFKYLFNTF